MDEWDWGHKVVLPCSLGGGTLFAVLTWLFICPYLRVKVTAAHEERENEKAKAIEAAEAEKTTEFNGISAHTMVAHVDDDGSEYDVDTGKISSRNVTIVSEPTDVDKGAALPSEQPQPEETESSCMWAGLGKAWNFFANNTYRQDLHAISLGESKRAAAIWESNTEFDLKTESLFQYLQIFTACLAAFAHGANDVANAIAPVSGILEIYKNGEFASKADVNKGILAMGGAAIGLGFTFFGYRIVKAVGFKLTAMSPSRGFCIELGASLAVSLASFMQIPVSTTQCLVGATCGVGLAAGGIHNVEWMFLLRTLTGWIGIFFVVAIITAGFFAFCVYSPSL